MVVVNKKYEMDMCSGSVLKKMIFFAVPLMCSSILQLLFNAADIVVVGRFAGDNSLAAVGSNGALINLLTNVFMGLSVGANVLTAQYFGAKQDKDLRETVHTAMTLSIYSGLFLTVVGIVFARILLELMQAPEEVLNLAVLYLRIYFLGMTATMVYNFGSAILRAVGDTKRPLYYLFGAGVVNVVLNLFFVIVLKMDVAGVAAATAISQSISAALVVRCLVKETGGIHLDLKALGIRKEKLLKIMQIGLPAGFQGMVFSLSNVVIQSAVNSFGAISIAGNSAASNIEGFVYMAMNAFYQATISFVSQNYGAGHKKRIGRTVWIGEGCVITVGLVFGNLAVLLGDPLLHIYSDSDAVIAAGMVRLAGICSCYALCGIMDVMVGALRGIGYSIIPTIVSLIGVCGLRLVWLATVFQMPDYHRIEIVYLSYPITWSITIVVNVICFLCVRKRAYRKSLCS
jgi:putative MATE family efflux protein